MRPNVGDIRLFGGSYMLEGWLICAGDVIPIERYRELYAVIGTKYGGDGVETFALPNIEPLVSNGAGYVGYYIYQG